MVAEICGNASGVSAMSVPNLDVDVQHSRRIDVRGPFERAIRSTRHECILCAVDCAALRWFGAFAPLHRLPERRRRQIAATADWLLSFDARALIALQPPAANATYLTHVLERMQTASSLPIHLPAQVAPAREPPRAIAQHYRALLQQHAAGATLLGRIQSINRLPLRPAIEAMHSSQSCRDAPQASSADAIAFVANGAQRTLVLGDWFELALLRPRLQHAAPAAVPAVFDRTPDMAL